MTETVLAGPAFTRYADLFFDIHNNGFQRDENGSECADVEAARIEAMHALPEIAKFAIPEDGDDQSYTVLVRDEAGAVVYYATLTFAGLRMDGGVKVGR